MSVKHDNTKSLSKPTKMLEKNDTKIQFQNEYQVKDKNVSKNLQNGA